MSNWITITTGIVQLTFAVRTSAETILTLKNRESIHFAKFGYDTYADTLFWRINSFYESIFGKIQHKYEDNGCEICIMEVE